MNVYERFSEAVTRLAAVTSIARTRREDAVRREVHNGENGELIARVESALVRVEQQLASLEKARLGRAPQGRAPLHLGATRQLAAWPVVARHGRAPLSHGLTGRGTARQVTARLFRSWPGQAPLYWSRLGATRRGGAGLGESRFGMAPLGLAGLPESWHATARRRLVEARPGVTGHGEARFGWAGHGWARHRAPSTNTAASWGT